MTFSQPPVEALMIATAKSIRVTSAKFGTSIRPPTLFRIVIRKIPSAFLCPRFQSTVSNRWKVPP
jgi:hypothetical protein